MLTKILSLILTLTAHAGPHDHHTRHNMVVYGEKEVFASHIVYKKPHNYQVILKLNLGSHQPEYEQARRENPSAQFIFLLDEMNISEIEKAAAISGRFFYTVNEKEIDLPRLELPREKFRIVYFSELPLSLDR